LHDVKAMKNLGSGSIDAVSASSVLVSGSTYTNTWQVTFSAQLGNVPGMTIEAGDADLSSVGADVSITTVQVYLDPLKSGTKLRSMSGKP